MEFLLVFSLHFLVMGALVMLLSGFVAFFIRRIHFLIIVLISMLAGYLYSIVFEVPNLALFSIGFNAILSLIAIGLVKAGLYAKEKAEEGFN
jgi:hypothetical protein